jgi:hypothetical protein
MHYPAAIQLGQDEQNLNDNSRLKYINSPKYVAT